MLTDNEVQDCIDLFWSIWHLYQEQDEYQYEVLTKIWKRQLSRYTKNQVEDAIYHIQATQTGRNEPSMKEIIDTIELLKKTKKAGTGNRRIKTAEEDIADLYDELIQALGKVKDPDRREEIRAQAERIKPYWDLFNGEGWLERYQHYFNTTKTREEYEKL